MTSVVIQMSRDGFLSFLFSFLKLDYIRFRFIRGELSREAALGKNMFLSLLVLIWRIQKKIDDGFRSMYRPGEEGVEQRTQNAAL